MIFICLKHQYTLVCNITAFIFGFHETLSPALLPPVSLDVIMTILGDHQGPLGVAVPHHTAQLVSVVPHCLVISLEVERL